MALNDKLVYLNGTKAKLKYGINLAGGNIQTGATFRSYYPSLKQALLRIVNTSPERIWENWKNVTGSGTQFILDDTEEARIKKTYKGNTFQQNYKGIQLLQKQCLSTPITDSDFWHLSSIETGTVTPLEDGWVRVEKNNTSNETIYVNCYLSKTAMREYEPNTDYTILIEWKNNIGFRTYSVSEGIIDINPFTTNASAAVGDYSPGRQEFLLKTKNPLPDDYRALRMFGTLPANTFGSIEVRALVAKGNYRYINQQYEPYIDEKPAPSPDFPQEIIPATEEQNVRVGSRIVLPNSKVSGYARGVTFTYNNDGTYSATGKSSSATQNSALYIHYGEFNLKAGTYYFISTEDANCGITMYVTYEDNTNAYLNMYNANSITIPKNIVKADIYLQVKKGTPTVYNNLKIYPILSTIPITAQDWEDDADVIKTLDLGDIELCKNGNYQDKIYWKEGYWWLRKEIDKKNFKNITFEFNESNQTIKGAISDIAPLDVDIKVSDIYCTHYLAKSINQIINKEKGISIAQTPHIYIYDENYDTVEEFNNFLDFVSNNDIIFYYPLATPIETKITDEDMLDQLDELWDMHSIEANTVVEITADNTPMIIDAIALGKEQD